MDFENDGVLVDILANSLIKSSHELDVALGRLNLPKKGSYKTKMVVGEEISIIERIEAKIIRLMVQIERRI
jgi:hypothetical protein